MSLFIYYIQTMIFKHLINGNTHTWNTIHIFNHKIKELLSFIMCFFTLKISILDKNEVIKYEIYLELRCMIFKYDHYPTFTLWIEIQLKLQWIQKLVKIIFFFLFFIFLLKKIFKLKYYYMIYKSLLRKSYQKKVLLVFYTDDFLLFFKIAKKIKKKKWSTYLYSFYCLWYLQS
jgi:hypothetical protein